MINKPSPFKGHNIRIPSTIPIRRRGFMKKGSTSGLGLICVGFRAAQLFGVRQKAFNPKPYTIGRYPPISCPVASDELASGKDFRIVAQRIGFRAEGSLDERFGGGLYLGSPKILGKEFGGSHEAKAILKTSFSKP